MFGRFVELQRAAYGSSDGREFEAIAPRVRQILAVQADKAGRIEAWQDAARSGEIFGAGGEEIPERNYKLGA